MSSIGDMIEKRSNERIIDKLMRESPEIAKSAKRLSEISMALSNDMRCPVCNQLYFREVFDPLI